MTTGKHDKFWTLLIILLIAIIIAGGVIAWLRYGSKQPIEITTPPGQELTGTVYIHGAITSPGYYPLKAGDKLADIVQAAGGTTSTADPDNTEIYIPSSREKQQPQKIDINRAEDWLLQALPDIGPARAQAIIDYRQQNGPFQHTYQLTSVEGIGNATYEKIKHLITVAD